jgi:hypothetical protein
LNSRQGDLDRMIADVERVVGEERVRHERIRMRLALRLLRRAYRVLDSLNR